MIPHDLYASWGLRAVASIQQHGDKWRVQVSKNGVRKSAIWDTYKEAEKWGKATEREIEANAVHGKSFRAAVEHYQKTVSAHKADPDWERRRFAVMVDHFGAGTMLAAIDSDSISEWKNWRMETVSGSTVQREANLLRNLFSVAVDEWKWIAKNPFKGVRLPKENPPRRSVWTWQLIRRVLRAKRTGKTAEMQRAFHIALHTGLRLQEALTGVYDPARKVVTLPKSKGEREVVTVPVTRRAARMLTTKPFTVGPDEGSVLFSKLCRDLLIEGLTFHDARATALTLLSRRMDVMTLARISRHKDLRILLNTYYRETADQIAARL